MQLRICIVGHCGRGGHCGADKTFEIIHRHFYWKNMKSDIAVFCNTCLHCLATVGVNRVPRPLAHALHSDKPNELIHFDFLYLGECDAATPYCLIVRDDATSFVCLNPALRQVPNQ